MTLDEFMHLHVGDDPHDDDSRGYLECDLDGMEPAELSPLIWVHHDGLEMVIVPQPAGDTLVLDIFTWKDGEPMNSGTPVTVHLQR